MSNLDSLGYGFLNIVWEGQEREGWATVVKAGHWAHPHWTQIEGEEHEEGSFHIYWALEDALDLYFCPNLFSERSRTEGETLPCRWLYADLDEADPRGLDIRPTVWWETSRKRYQALWLLSRAISPLNLKRLNQKLTYYCEADTGGWDLTQVLRVPGSISTKYESEGLDDWFIDIPDFGDAVYDPQEVWSEVKGVETPPLTDLAAKVKPKKVNRELMSRVPTKVKVKLRKKNMGEGLRNEFLKGMVLDLIEAGFTKREVKGLALTCAVYWEKFRDPGADIDRLLEKHWDEKHPKEAPKKIPKASSNGHRETGIVDLAQFMARDVKLPGWLVENVWSEEADGFIAGEAKSLKSLLALDLLVSAASGTQFLNHFDVPTEGPALYIQRENHDGFMKDRFEKILMSKGLSGEANESGDLIRLPRKLPLHILSNSGFRMNDEDWMWWLEKKIRKLGLKLIVFDPLTFLAGEGVDLNSDHQMSPILGRLMDLKHKYGVGMLIVHHYKKQDRSDPMMADPDRITGTSAFQRWYESALLVEKDGMGKVKIYPLHRMHAPSPEVHVEFDMGGMGDAYYNPIVTVPRDDATEFYETVREALKQSKRHGEVVTVAELAEATGMRGETCKRWLSKMNDVKILPTVGRQSPVVKLR